MTGAVPDPFAGHADGALMQPRPIVPTPAIMGGQLRGKRVIVGLPGHGWRHDMRADERVIQGSRTYVPVMSEAEWYRAEAEQTEVFAPLIPVERVWVEDFGVAARTTTNRQPSQRLVSLDEPPRRVPLPSLDADALTGRRVIQVLDNGEEHRDLRAVTEIHNSEDGGITARVTAELDWYRWGWSGKFPPTLEISVHALWLE